MENSSTTTLRAALPKDLPSILQIEHTSFAGDRFSKRQFSYLIAKAKASFTVACWDERVIGYSILLLPSHHRSARIYSIAIFPEAKGKGIGKMLLQFHLELAQNHNYTEVRLEVREDNHSAIALYQSRGFQPIGIKSRYYEDGMNAILMALKFAKGNDRNSSG